jgi:hypothetical protein
VRHPEDIACSPNDRDMVVYAGDELIHVEASLVETLEPIPAAETGRGGHESGVHCRRADRQVKL